MNERLIRILGTLVAVIIVFDLAAIVSWDSLQRDGGSWRERNPLPSELTALPELERFVERARGLRFKEPVAIELVDKRELTAARRREEQLGGPGGYVEPTSETDPGAVFGLMGLLPPSVDVDAAVDDAHDDGVVGVYFPRQKRLLVLGRELTPFVRQVLVHELTHALDDQYFDLGRVDVALHDDEGFESWRALAEGNATSVEKQYLDSLPEAERQQALDEAAAFVAGAGPRTPTLIDDLLSYPYVAGLAFVEALRADGGNKAVNAAFRKPPTTSEQILRPDHFLDRDTPSLVKKPTPQGTALGRGVLGVLGIGMLLSTAHDGPVIRDALAGWDGDRFVVWIESDKACLALHVANDSPAAATKLGDALRGWLANNPAGSVAVEGDLVTLQRCV